METEHSIRATILAGLVVLSLLAGIPFPTNSTVSASSSGTITVSSGSITVTDYQLLNESGYTQEPLTAEVTVNNTLSKEATKKVVVEAYLEGEWQTIGSRNVTVNANSNKTVPVQYVVNQKPDDGTLKLRVNNLENSSIPIHWTEVNVVEVSVSDSTIQSGNSTTVSAKLENYGTTTIERIVTLDWGSSSATKTVSVAPGSTETIEFSPTLHIPGFQILVIDDARARVVQVTESTDIVQVSNRTLQTSKIYRTEKIRANATVTNTGDKNKTYAVTLIVENPRDQIGYRTEYIPIPANESKNVSLAITAFDVGDYEVSLNGKTIGNTSVQRQYSVTNATAVDESVFVGNQLTLTANFTNERSTAIEIFPRVEEYVNGEWEYRTAKEITLNASETKEVTYQVDTATLGTKVFRIGPSKNLTVDVRTRYNVTSINVSDKTPYTDVPVWINATVKNRLDSELSTNISLAELYSDGDRYLIEKKAVTLNASEKTTVRFKVSFDNAGEWTFAVGNSPFTLNISDNPVYVQEASAVDHYIQTGNTTTVTATLRNPGETTVPYQTVLYVNGEIRGAQTTDVPAGGTSQVTFTPAFSVPGAHSVRVGWEQGILHVSDPNTSVNVTNQTVKTPEIFAGQSLKTNATITNNGSNSTSYAVTLGAFSKATESLQTKIISIPAGENKSIQLNTTLYSPGDYLVVINNETIGRTTVKRWYNATNITVNDSSVIAGQPVTITANITNRREKTMDGRVELTIFEDSWWRELDSTRLELAPGETKQVTFQTTFTTPGEQTLRVGNSKNVTVDINSTVNVTDIQISDATPTGGSPIWINATIKNRRNQSITTKITLDRQYENGYWSTRNTQTVSLNASETKTVRFRAVFDDEGKRTLRVETSDPFTISVKERIVHVGSVTVSDRTIEPGNNTTVTATLRNFGETNTDYQVTLNIDGREHESGSRQLQKTVYVRAGDTTTVEFTPKFIVGGAHELKVGHTEAGLVTVASPNVSVRGGSVSKSTSYKHDPVNIDVVLNNTANTSEKFAISVRADLNTSEWSTVTDTSVVTVSANSTETKTLTVRPYSVGNYTITANGKLIDTLQVERGVKIENISFSEKTVAVGENLTITQKLRNPTEKERRHSIFIGNQNLVENVPKNTTIQTSQNISFKTAGPKRVWVEGKTYTVYAVNDTTGTTNLTFRHVYTQQQVVNNTPTGFYAAVQNTGNATAVRNVTLTINGSVVASETVFVQPNQTRPVYLEHTFTNTGPFSGTLTIQNSSTHSFSGEVRSAVVVDDSVSVSYVSGTNPDDMPVVDAKYMAGSIYVRATQNGDYVRDLSALGIDQTTKLNISFLVRNYTPRIVVGNGHDVNLTLTNTSQPNTTRVSVHIKPGQVDYKFDFAGERPSRPSKWDEAVQNNTADFGWDTAIQFRVGNAEAAVPSVNTSVLSGMTVSTDAQMFTMPRYVPGDADTPPHLEVSLAAPHKTVEGNVNQGYYEAYLPASLLDAWNVTNPKEQLTASFGHQDVNMSITNVSGGVLVDISLHYSSGTLQIQKTSTSTSDTEETANISITDTSLSETTITTGSNVTVNVTLENTGNASGSMELTFTENDTKLFTENVTVSANSTEVVSFNRTYEATGSYTLAVNTIQIGTVDVTTDSKDSSGSGDSSAGTPSIKVTDATLSETNITAGTTVTITATVNNTGTAAGTKNITLYINGTPKAEKEVSLNASNSTTITFERPFDTAGEYSLKVENESLPTLTVTEAETTTTTGSTPGFGVVAMLVALVGLLFYRRRP